MGAGHTARRKGRRTCCTAAIAGGPLARRRDDFYVFEAVNGAESVARATQAVARATASSIAACNQRMRVGGYKGMSM